MILIRIISLNPPLLPPWFSMLRHSLSPTRTWALLLAPVMLLACSGGAAEAPQTPGPVQSQERPSARAASHSTGLLVMAHGGGGRWDEAVARAGGSPARRAAYCPCAGNGRSDDAGRVPRLPGAPGVERVAVVRLFVSGTSFLTQTRYLLGLGPAPEYFISHHGAMDDGGIPQPIAHALEVATHDDGLVDHEVTGRILLERSQALSTGPGSESVLWLAHGLGDPDSNRKLEEAMAGWAGQLSALGFSEARAATLREDWPEARERAEAEIQDWVAYQTRPGEAGSRGAPPSLGLRTLRGGASRPPLYQGAGPAPHPAITDWIRGKLEEIERAQGWRARTAPGSVAQLSGTDEGSSLAHAPVCSHRHWIPAWRCSHRR